MIYFEPTAGLCNRLWALQSALAVAKKYQTDITILWSKTFYLGSYFSDLFEPIKAEDFNNIKIKFIESPRYFNYLLRKWILPMKCKNVINDAYMGELVSTYPPPRRVLTDDEVTDLRCKAGSLTVAPLFNNLIKIYKQHSLISSSLPFYPSTQRYDFLVPLKSIRTEIDTLVDSFKNTVGIHVRTGEFEASESRSLGSPTNIPIYNFIQTMHTILCKEPDKTFYVATDSDEAKQKLRSEFGNKVICSQHKFSRKSDDGMKQAVIDLFCLSKTKQIYGSYASSFTFVAAEMGKVPKFILK